MQLKLNDGTVVHLYDDITHLPIRLFNLSNEYSMQDFEIGNKMSDVDRHYNRMFMFMGQQKYDDALQVMKNMYQTHYMMLNKINFKSLTFGCFVRAINDTAVTDYSVDAVNAMMDRLSDSGLTQEMVQNMMDQLKKKIEGQLAQFYPHKYGRTGMLEFYSFQKSLITAQLKWIIEGGDKYLESIEKVHTYFANLDKPKCLDPDSEKNYIVRSRKQFQQLCITLMTNGVDRPDEMSVFAFMETIQFYETKRKSSNGPIGPNPPRRAPIHARGKR